MNNCFVVEINQARYFCTIVETGNLRRAAELLGMSPGALSKSMSTLQSELCVALFVPEGRGLSVTDSGHSFYSQARRLIQDWELLAQNVRATKPTNQPIRIASIELFSTHFMGKIISNDFKDEAFSVVERLPGEIERSVFDRESDIGLTFAPVPRPGLDFLKIGTFHKQVFARRGAFAGLPLSEVPFSAPKISITRSTSGETDLDGWPSNIQRFVKYHFDLLETTLVMARMGLCAIFAPDFVIPIQNDVCAEEHQLVPLPQASKGPILKRDIFLIKRKSDSEGSTIKKIARRVRLSCK